MNFFVCFLISVVVCEEIRITHPPEHEGDTYLIKTSLFGSPEWGERVSGRFIYAAEGEASQWCTANSYRNPDEKFIGDEILVVKEPSSCRIADQVLVAQDKGYMAVAVVERSTDIQEAPMYAEMNGKYNLHYYLLDMLVESNVDGRTDDNVVIPSVTIKNKRGGELIFDIIRSGETVAGDITWGSNSVHTATVDFWYLPHHPSSYVLAQFANVATALQHKLQFRAHSITVDPLTTESSSYSCLPNQPSVCMSNSKQVPAITALWESMRRLCIWQMTATTSPGMFDPHIGSASYSHVYWKYIDIYDFRCPWDSIVTAKDDEKFGRPCSDVVLKSLGILPETILKCVDDRGQDLMKKQLGMSSWGERHGGGEGIVRVDGVLLVGAPSVSTMTDAICASYHPSTMPDMCRFSRHFSKEEVDKMLASAALLTAKKWLLVALMWVVAITILIVWKYCQRMEARKLNTKVGAEILAQKFTHTDTHAHKGNLDVYAVSADNSTKTNTPMNGVAIETDTYPHPNTHQQNIEARIWGNRLQTV
eukprot:GHVR01002238.1.p1 GENE.GHVR01002238.1~~GHVR01002238.1.p1  ORF type:complete len:534 (+),score=116.83 GHVR01002238.1:28-1629(+)